MNKQKEDIQLYSYEEIKETLKQAFTEKLTSFLNQGYIIEETGSISSTVVSTILKNDKHYIRLLISEVESDNRYHLSLCVRTSKEPFSFYADNLEKTHEFVACRKYRTELFVTKEDYDRFILPKVEERKKNRAFKDHQHYKKINTELLTDNILERIKSFKGFKRATRDNIRIFKKQWRWGTEYFINCGTKNILYWNNKGLDYYRFHSWINFDREYENSI